LDTSPSLALFTKELELVVTVDESAIPEIYPREGQPMPDRHFLLGLVQTAGVLLEERDPESVAVLKQCSIRLERGETVISLDSAFVIVRPVDGRLGVLAVGDWQTARRLARKAVRHFTTAIRIDVP
jgi:hypothetical protein